MARDEGEEFRGPRALPADFFDEHEHEHEHEKRACHRSSGVAAAEAVQRGRARNEEEEVGGSGGAGVVSEEEREKQRLLEAFQEEMDGEFFAGPDDDAKGIDGQNGGSDGDPENAAVFDDSPEIEQEIMEQSVRRLAARRQEHAAMMKKRKRNAAGVNVSEKQSRGQDPDSVEGGDDDSDEDGSEIEVDWRFKRRA